MWSFQCKSGNALVNPPVCVYSFLGVLWPRTHCLPSTGWIRNPVKKRWENHVFKILIRLYLRTSDKCAGWSLESSPDFKNLKGNVRWVESSNQLSTLGFVQHNCIHLFPPCGNPWYLSVCFASRSPGQLEQHVFQLRHKSEVTARTDGRLTWGGMRNWWPVWARVTRGFSGSWNPSGCDHKSGSCEF